MTVTAFDDFGVEFDIDQYEKMNFALEIEMTGIYSTRGLQAKKIPNSLQNFTVKGIEPGNYVVTAYVDSHEDKRISSEANKIEVFPIL